MNSEKNDRLRIPRLTLTLGALLLMGVSVASAQKKTAAAPHVSAPAAKAPASHGAGGAAGSHGPTTGSHGPTTGGSHGPTTRVDTEQQRVVPWSVTPAAMERKRITSVPQEFPVPMDLTQATHRTNTAAAQPVETRKRPSRDVPHGRWPQRASQLERGTPL